MKLIDIKFFALFFCFFFMCINLTLGEGTKELEPLAAGGESNPTKLHLSKYTDPGSADYNNFALYVAAVNERLQITIGTVGEVIHFGFKPQPTGTPNNPTDPQISCRIKNQGGTVVWGPQILAWQTGNPGFIDTYDQANIGPSVLVGGTGGYDAISFAPGSIGDFYIEFDFPGTNTTRTFDYFDITVGSAAGMKIPGRVWSRAWQFTTDASDNVSRAVLYPYTDDGITTSIDFNGISPYRFAVSCNATGCNNLGFPATDRKSVTGKHTYPQFRIFLNEPDHTISYFPIGELGVLQSATIQVINCDGTTVLKIMVNKNGFVKLTIVLPPPYVNRIMDNILVDPSPAENIITWDGLDGNGTPVAVANGTSFSISVEYINGLTNLPLYDAEYMNYGNPGAHPVWTGFLINLVSPTSPQPIKKYWDDTQISVCATECVSTLNCGGSKKREVGGKNDLTGCNSATGCHPWDYCIGNENTVNTWWYALSENAIDIYALVEKRYPADPGTITGLTSVCAGTTQSYSVVQEPNSVNYLWTWPTGVVPVSTPPFTNTIILDFTTAAPGLQTITVQGNNAECGTGPVASLDITVLPIPNLINQPTAPACSGIGFSIPLISNPSATSYSWTVTGTDCSSNIAICPTGTFNGSTITGNLTVTDLNPGSVVYHVTPSAGTCNGIPKTITVTVAPKPNVTSPVGQGEQICTGGSTNINLESGLTGPSLTWSWLPQCSNILSCPAQGTSANISHTLQLLNSSVPGSVIYSITPTYGGCAGDQVDYTVTVAPLPDVQLIPFTPVCLNTQAFALAGGTPTGPGGVYTLAGNPITIFDPAIAGEGTHLITYTYTDANGCVNSKQENILVQSLITPSLNGNISACLGISETYTTDPTGVQSSYQWTVSPDGTPSGTIPEERTFTWSSAGAKTVQVSYTDINGCATTPATKTVVVHQLPTPTILTGSFNVCHSVSYTYTTQPNKGNYSWSVSPGNTLTFVNETATVVWKVISGNEYIEVNYTDANGCTAVSPTRVIVNVNQSPVYTVSGSSSVCAGSQTSYQLQGAETGTWSLPAGGSLVLPITNINSVNVNWSAGFSAASATLTVNYINALGCSGSTSTPVTIQPLPVTTFTATTPPPVCQDYPTPSLYTVDPGGVAASYNWQVNPATNAAIPDNTANPASITWKLSGNTPQTVQLTLEATTTATTPACSAISAPMLVTINPKPDVQIASCIDLKTTLNAKPILLKGGTPLGATGKYYIDQAIPVKEAVWFNPTTAGEGFHTIFYGYTNNNGCIAYASGQIEVKATNAGFPCGGSFLDVRDNESYKTVWINTQCWMQENLRHKAPSPYVSSPYTMPQTDNCTVERYCLGGDPGCTQYGGFYQWDELLQYNSDVTITRQGFCPPGWHVPDESEWTTLINNISGNLGDGVAGSFLLDQNTGGPFKAKPAGIFYQNSLEAFTTLTPQGVFFWTSSYDPAAKRVVARGLNSENPSVSRYEASKADAFPVRCIKD